MGGFFYYKFLFAEEAEVVDVVFTARSGAVEMKGRKGLFRGYRHWKPEMPRKGKL